MLPGPGRGVKHYQERGVERDQRVKPGCNQPHMQPTKGQYDPHCKMAKKIELKQAHMNAIREVLEG